MVGTHILQIALNHGAGVEMLTDRAEAVRAAGKFEAWLQSGGADKYASNSSFDKIEGATNNGGETSTIVLYDYVQQFSVIERKEPAQSLMPAPGGLHRA